MVRCVPGIVKQTIVKVMHEREPSEAVYVK
ncbi:hypothetical protein E2C01_099834 [Portunus trituberculatus]|uniref:Uncharacterized protein n=1 Tax=Portunus trituberculatus TaxID=210409 RepID=A0A5B7K4U1_PORTR|nr:hypothetical protein [Portunus trituberculatus]